MADAYIKARTNILVLREGKTIEDFKDMNIHLRENGEYHFDIAPEGCYDCFEDYADVTTPVIEGVHNSRCFTIFDACITYSYEHAVGKEPKYTNFVKKLEEVIEPGQVIINMGVMYCKHRYVTPFKTSIFSDITNGDVFVVSNIYGCTENLIGILDTGIKIYYEGKSIYPDYDSMHARALEIINNNKWDKANKRIQY